MREDEVSAIKDKVKQVENQREPKQGKRDSDRDSKDFCDGHCKARVQSYAARTKKLPPAGDQG